MIQFIKNISSILPYDRSQYIKYLNDDVKENSKWYGISLQQGIEKDFSLENVQHFKSIFGNIIQTFDKEYRWIINHDDKDLKWFLNESNNLLKLRHLFFKHKVDIKFKGGIVLDKDDLIEIIEDLILYPFHSYPLCLYKNLDISNQTKEIIIKPTGHFSLDLLSTDKFLLKNLVDQNASDKIILKEYRGTNIL